MMTFKVLRADRASANVEVGMTLYPAGCSYGCADDDSRRFGIEYTSVSADPSGYPFFTIPKADIERASPDGREGRNG